jgi:hypothetical protein
MKASKGQKSPKFQKPVILSMFNAKQSINNANVLLENVNFYAKEKFQFYTMILHILKKKQNFKLAINGY